LTDWRHPEFEDDGASFIVRRAEQLQRRYPNDFARPQKYVYEHIFGRGRIRLLRIIRIPIFAALLFLAGSIVFTLCYALWQLTFG
jgi:hypothetical protein